MNTGYNPAPMPAPNATPPGSKMLQVVSILMIVFGAIATVVDLIALIGVFALIALGANPILILAAILLIAGGIGELVVGIIGVINCKDPSKAQMLLICGVVIGALTLLGNIMYMIFDSFNVFSLFSGLLFPILFVVGAIQLKNGNSNPGAPGQF